MCCVSWALLLGASRDENHFLIFFSFHSVSFFYYNFLFSSPLSLASSSFGRSFCCLGRFSQFLHNRLESWQRSDEIGQEFPFEVSSSSSFLHSNNDFSFYSSSVTLALSNITYLYMYFFVRVFVFL